MTDRDAALLSALSRLRGENCPSIATLGDLLDAKLAEDAAALVGRHLQACPFCTNRFIDLRDSERASAARDVPPELAEKAKLLVPQPRDTPQLTAASEYHVRPSWRTRLSEWLSLRAFQFATVGAFVVLVVYLSPLSWLFDRNGRERLHGALLASPAQVLLASLSMNSEASSSFLAAVHSALQALPKTLILEQTRGATNVQVYKRAAPATVLVVAGNALGSGAVVDASGMILTNWHVIKDATQLAVVFKPVTGIDVRDDLAVASTIATFDPVADLALLTVAAMPSYVSPLSLARPTSLEVGQDVHAIGHPDGQVWTYTTGTISQIRPHYQWNSAGDNFSHQATVIQTQTAINAGNSGGPLLNDRGELVGINAFRSVGGEGLNYAIAVDTVKEFLAALRPAVAGTKGASQRVPSRTERYGPRIEALYVSASSKQPDIWFVYPDPPAKGVILYAAAHSERTPSIDTVCVPSGKTLSCHYDLDCDGRVDLLGTAPADGGAVTAYGVPGSPRTMRELVPELIAALKAQVIPQAALQLCGGTN